MDHDVHIAGRFAGGGIGFEKRLEERFGGLDALLLVAASEPSEIEKHRVVMDKTDRQVEHPFPDVFIIDIEGKLALRRIGNICVGVIPERGEVVLAARARRVLSRQPLDERIRPVEVDGLLLKRQGDVVIPHVIGDFVLFPHGAPEYFRI